jgi:hypothetical protein
MRTPVLILSDLSIEALRTDSGEAWISGPWQVCRLKDEAASSAHVVGYMRTDGFYEVFVPRTTSVQLRLRPAERPSPPVRVSEEAPAPEPGWKVRTIPLRGRPCPDIETVSHLSGTSITFLSGRMVTLDIWPSIVEKLYGAKGELVWRRTP